MNQISPLKSLIPTWFVKLFFPVQMVVLAFVSTACSNDQVKKVDSKPVEIVSKDTVSAPSQSLTIYTDYSARLFNGGSVQSFDIHVSTKHEDSGVRVKTGYKGDNETLMNGIKSLDQTINGGYVITLKSASLPIIISSNTSSPLFVDSTNKVSYKAFTSTSLLWERITIQDVASEDAAKEKYKAFMNSLRGGDSKIVMISGRGVDNQIVINNNLLSFK